MVGHTLIRHRSARVARSLVAIALCCLASLPGARAFGQGTGPSQSVRALKALHLSELAGKVPVFYSEGLAGLAAQQQKNFIDDVAWFRHRLHVSAPVRVALLNETDWNRLGTLPAYPMADAVAGAGILYMPDSWDRFPGQNVKGNLPGKLEFISYHETGHLYQRALKLPSPDLFLAEFYATLLATAYVQEVGKPELVTAVLTSREETGGEPRRPFTSFEDMDLIYEGVGFDEYDWFQVETTRLAAFFLQGRDIGDLVVRLRQAFAGPATLSTHDILARLDAIHPGFLAAAGDLAKPTSLPLMHAGACAASPVASATDAVVGIRNRTGHPVTIVEDGHRYALPVGDSAQYGKAGSQFRLHDGTCVTYGDQPGYVVLQ